MTPEQLDEARYADAKARADRSYPGGGLHHAHLVMLSYRQHVVDNWTPPDPISPRVIAAREWLKGNHTAGVAPTIDRGEYDRNFEVSAFLAGFAAAVKLAEPVVNSYRRALLLGERSLILQTYRQSIGDE